MRVAFDEAGTVLRFGRDDDRRGVCDHDRRHRKDNPRSDGPRGDMHPARQFDTVAANQRLTQAGHSVFGLMRQQGPRVLLDAANPDAETVTLELDRQDRLGARNRPLSATAATST